MLIVEKYLIIHSADENSVHILRIVHGTTMYENYLSVPVPSRFYATIFFRV
jgi:hypothetical protein